MGQVWCCRELGSRFTTVTDVEKTLVVNLPQTDNDAIELIEWNPEHFFCVPTTPAEINNKSNKSTGFYNIDPYIVKQIALQIVNQLANIFNRLFLTGIFPSKLKLAKVITLYKTKDPALFSNYRPISLIPVVSKILERLMYNRLYNFLTEHNILSMNQFGFRKKYSTFFSINGFGGQHNQKHWRRQLQYRIVFLIYQKLFIR